MQLEKPKKSWVSIRTSVCGSVICRDMAYVVADDIAICFCAESRPRWTRYIPVQNSRLSKDYGNRPLHNDMLWPKSTSCREVLADLPRFVVCWKMKTCWKLKTYSEAVANHERRRSEYIGRESVAFVCRPPRKDRRSFGRVGNSRTMLLSVEVAASSHDHLTTAMS